MSTSKSSKSPDVIVIAGYGPSIGESTARLFGSKGYTIACLGRTKSKLETGVERLRSSGISAFPFVLDCGNSSNVKEVIRQVQSEVGRISVIVWNAANYCGSDLLSSEEDPNKLLSQIVSVGCGGLLASVQQALGDLKANKGTVLITGGGLSIYDDQVDAIAVQNGWMGLAFCKSSQRKMAGLLHQKLKPDGVMVGTVVISGEAGTGEDATDPNEIAQKFWEIHQTRDRPEIHLGSMDPLASKLS
jgi:NADP-dependent 3-hydroxy acid dehydrogenase YdfG